MKRVPRGRRLLAIPLIGLACLSCGAQAVAQAPIPTPPIPASETMRTQVLGPGLAVLSYGPRGNVAVSYGADGILLVDGMYGSEGRLLDSAIKALSPAPVRILIDTHWHHDHADGNEHFARTGALVMSHANVRARMAADQFMFGLNRHVPASPPIALPTVTYETGVTLRLNADTLRVIHIPNAHTDGDSIVYWETANVLHMGDIFNRVSFPFIGLSEGGSIDGMIAGANRGLEIADERTRILPGHGGVATRDDLRAYRDMLLDIRTKVAAGISAGRSLAEIAASRPTARYVMASQFIKPDLFVELVYLSLRPGAETRPTQP